MQAVPLKVKKLELQIGVFWETQSTPSKTAWPEQTGAVSAMQVPFLSVPATHAGVLTVMQTLPPAVLDPAGQTGGLVSKQAPSRRIILSGQLGGAAETQVWPDRVDLSGQLGGCGAIQAVPLKAPMSHVGFSAKMQTALEKMVSGGHTGGLLNAQTRPLKVNPARQFTSKGV
jgi:hypothetical protein